MLKILRKKGVAKKILWFITIIIVISFGFFGTAYLITSSGGANSAGKIFGKTVKIEDFEKAYKSVEIQGIMRYGQNFNSVRQYLNLDAETWDRLILLRETKKRKIKINDDDVVKAIEEYAFFQRDGKFDNQLYSDILQYAFQCQAVFFEDSIRDGLKFTKLYEEVTSSVQITENDAFEEFKKQNEKIQVSYILIPFDQFTQGISIEIPEAEKYYQENKINFMVPPSTNLEYVILKFPDPDPSAKDKAIADEAKKPILERASAVYQELQSAASMKEVAQKNSLEVKETGFFDLNQPSLSLELPMAVLSQALRLQGNETTEPIEINNGVAIAKIKEKKEAYIPTFDDIKDKVKNELALKKAQSIAQGKAQEYLNAITEKYNSAPYKDFAETVKPLGLTLEQTPAFNRGQYLPKIGISKEFQDVAFTLTEENRLAKSIAKAEKGFCILHLDSYIPAEKVEFNKDREKLTEGLLNQRKAEKFNEFLTQLRAEAKVVDNISNLRKQNQ